MSACMLPTCLCVYVRVWMFRFVHDSSREPPHSWCAVPACETLVLPSASAAELPQGALIPTALLPSLQHPLTLAQSCVTIASFNPVTLASTVTNCLCASTRSLAVTEAWFVVTAVAHCPHGKWWLYSGKP